MQGIIKATKTSKSGKSLGVCIDDKWYSSKAFELAGLQGKEITFTTSHQAFPDGGGIDWINDYSEIGGAPNTADQVMAQAMANQPPPMGQPIAPMAGTTVQAPQMAPQAPQSAPTVGKDRDASIVAQALTKACTAPGDDINKVWTTYQTLYLRYLRWNGEAEGMSVNDPDVPYSDEIPF